MDQLCPYNCTWKNATDRNLTEEQIYNQYILDGFRFWILSVIVPVIVTVGVTGNAVTVVVLTQRHMRSSTNVYLTALAISDLLHLAFVLTLSFEHYPDFDRPQYLPYWQYRPYGIWFTDATTSTSTWLTVTLTVERYIAVCLPLHGRVLCTESRARLAVCLAFMLCFIATATTPFEHMVGCYCARVGNSTEVILSVGLESSALGKNETYRNIYYLFSSISFQVLPLLLLIIFNTCLIAAVHRSTRTRRLMTAATERLRDHTTNNQRMENKITITLIAVVMLFLICQIPNSLILIYHSMNTAEHSVLEDFIFRVLGNISNLLIVINAAANFILYTALSAKYRRTLLTTVLRPCFPVFRRTNSASNTMDSSLSGRASGAFSGTDKGREHGTVIKMTTRTHSQALPGARNIQ